MNALKNLEQTVAGWLKKAPRLPRVSKVWLGDNLWWVAAVFAVLTAIAVLGSVMSVLGNLSMLGNPYVSYYTTTTIVGLAAINTTISLVFTAAICILLATAVTPLREKQKKGWSLVFVSLIVSAVSVAVGAVLTLNVFGFLANIIFGALWLAFAAYILFEAREQFIHVERSKGIKKNA